MKRYKERKRPERWMERITPERAAEIGTAVDRVIAARLEVPPWTITYYRRLHGIPRYRGPHGPHKGELSMFVRDILPMLPTLGNAEIARKVGCSNEYVRQVRRQAGYAPSPRCRPPGRQRTLVCPNPARLGFASDAALAAEWSVNPSTVRRWREEAGLPSFRSTYIGAEYDHLLGTLPDTHVADIIGIRASAVGRRRRRLGIPSWRPITLSAESLQRMREAQYQRWARYHAEKEASS